MIYTLTLNPAVDYVMSVPEMIRGEVNRSVAQRFSIAGKGVNVSLALKRKGIDSVAVCLCGQGFVGEEFARLLRANELQTVMITVPGCDTRINLKISEREYVTEVNGNFFVQQTAAQQVREALSVLANGDYLIIGGAIPEGIEWDFYAELSAELTAKGVLVIVDTSGDPLRQLVKTSAPFLIKPNQQELGSVFCMPIVSFEDAILYARRTGCHNVIVSMGELGAVLVTRDDVHVCHAPKVVKGGYTVGAGDALLAGFVAEYIKRKDYEKALIAGVNSATDYILGYEN
jgi:1-phosphofructokinase